ncbi:hypothetical protein DFR58_13044 [Anaerobacterium chartisolvens]|uniref:Radical SAM core domain-containing protein n=1 Tax=Anaerobacterium chartisolvens TaxID=1297424 RepID=A0A369APW2_9FIRM|nr:TIGR01212 family radical SAM protein [Anaerobacterium chartisolvens]RCX10378.1 hypothetical protein DFR58_13044 [Anaerobacterium chartisolvens]
MLYYKFSDYLKSKYGSKVYKLPLNIPATCPNRDGRLGTEGCIFCGGEGAGFEILPASLSISEQIKRNSQYIKDGYKAERFISYFQNYTNTYLPLNTFRQLIEEACAEGVVAVYISTRPDCIKNEYLEFLKSFKEERGVDIVIELGLQTVNYRTLRLLKRGHLLAEFIDAAVRINFYGLEVCAHYITDIPMDTLEDVTEGARIISALKVKQVKCHSLYILKGTELGEMYIKGELVPVKMEDFIDRTIAFLEYLDPSIVVQRLIGRAPESRSLFCGWDTSWWKIRDAIEQKMEAEGRFQGRKFNYLNGEACMKEF